MMDFPLEKFDKSENGSIFNFLRMARQMQLENRMRGIMPDNFILHQTLSDAISENVWDKTDEELLFELMDEMQEEKFEDEYFFDISKDLNEENNEKNYKP